MEKCFKEGAISALKVDFGIPKSGWMPVRTQGQQDEVEVLASYTPTDSVTELASKLGNFVSAGRDTSIVLSEETCEYILAAKEDNGLLRLSVTKHSDHRDQRRSEVVF